MSHGYVAVGWNRNKRRYDAVLWLGILAYLALFVGLAGALHPQLTLETALLRATGSLALLLLHLVLTIGPACRLAPSWLPLLYNRRHLGVSLFAVALGHGLLALVQYHALGDLSPLVSVLVSEAQAGAVPFQPFGVLALGILFVMAATSHDFWLAQLSPPVWKALHMLVYLAWAAVVLHVAFGVVQDEASNAMAVALGVGVVWVLGLHLAAAARERRLDAPRADGGEPGWVEACEVDTILEGRARTVVVAGERVALFRWGGRVAAVSAVCAHQNGPLGEGRILDGCITCPWHGYQYRPEDGCSPPPFTEKLPTFAVRVRDGRAQVRAIADAPGTPQTPVHVQEPPR